jgi:hypothetical protein
LHWAKYYLNPNNTLNRSSLQFTEPSGNITNPYNYNSYNEYVKSMMKYFNLDNPAPFVSARSWIMMNLDSAEVMFAKEEKVQR